MKYIYYKSDNGNFGDDLNEWLWPKFFGANDENSDKCFLGIGSVLYNDFPLIKELPPDKRKIVFGTGIRPTYKAFKFDKSWDIRFLRGPLSSRIFNNGFEYIADAAYCLRHLDNFKEFAGIKKKHEVSVIPYFKSVDYVDWESLCKDLNYNYISPYGEKGIEHTLKEIASSKLIITEAMHGAIIADLFRVPWNRFVLSTPFTEGQMVSEFKWMDWLFSVDIGNINTSQIKFYRKSVINRIVNKATFNMVNVEFLLKNRVAEDVYNYLSSVTEYYLSGERIMKQIDEKLYDKIHQLKKELAVVDYQR